jgi:hypothetical protein
MSTDIIDLEISPADATDIHSGRVVADSRNKSLYGPPSENRQKSHSEALEKRASNKAKLPQFESLGHGLRGPRHVIAAELPKGIMAVSAHGVPALVSDIRAGKISVS